MQADSEPKKAIILFCDNQIVAIWSSEYKNNQNKIQLNYRIYLKIWSYQSCILEIVPSFNIFKEDLW